MSRPLAGKNAIITGGSRGIGRAIAIRLAQSGANVMFTYKSQQSAAEELAQQLRSFDVQAEAVALDISNFADRTQLDHVIAQAKAFAGGVNCLINNAGIRQDSPLFLMSQEAWDNVIRTNLDGMYHVCRGIVPIFMKQKQGSVINITSVSGIIGLPGQTNYGATKAGMIGFTKALAKEVGRVGVRVNAVAPGFIETDMTAGLKDKYIEQTLASIPLNRFGKAEEVASLVHFLASDEASYITGQVFVIDGGLSS